MATRRRKDYKILYDTDTNTSLVIAQRVYETENPQVQTPITPLFLQRVITESCPLRPPSWKPRTITSCFINQSNAQGFSEFTVAIPYRPGNSLLKQHVNEIKNTEGVQSIQYKGESHPTNVLLFVSDS